MQSRHIMEVEGARAAIKETAFIFWGRLRRRTGSMKNELGNQKAVYAIHRLMRIRRQTDLAQSDYLRAKGDEADAYAPFNDEVDRPPSQQKCLRD